MQTHHYSIFINAPVETVWDTMLGQETYKEWTKVFNETSRYEGSWEQGAKILFLGTDPQTGEEGGMVSRIAENRLHEFISIEHVGVIENGKEDTESEKAKKWAPAYENYTFIAKDGGTQLDIDQDLEDEYAEMFDEMWGKALAKLKELAEGAA